MFGINLERPVRQLIRNINWRLINVLGLGKIPLGVKETEKTAVSELCTESWQPVAGGHGDEAP